MIMEPFKIAAKWWADQLRGGTKQDNGEKNQLVNVLAIYLGNGVGTTLADEFGSVLLRMMEEQKVDSFTLATDYHPEGLLRKAAEEVGIDCTCGPFPMKTVMWVERTKVKVKHGYGAPIQTLS